MANDQVCRTARPLVGRRESPASLPQLSWFLLLHSWNRLLTWEQKMLSGSNSTSIATTGLRSASSSEAILQGITCLFIYMFIYATTPSESIFEGCFLPLKIYSHHIVRLTKDPGAVWVVLHVRADREVKWFWLIATNVGQSIDQGWKSLISGHESRS